TDHGQFDLAGLDDGEYRVEVDALAPGELVDRAVAAASAPPRGRIAPAFAAARFADAPAEQEFHSADAEGVVRARLSEARGRLRLQVEVRRDSSLWGGQPLARFRVWNERSELLVQGYVGLHPLPDGHGVG